MVPFSAMRAANRGVVLWANIVIISASTRSEGAGQEASEERSQKG